MRTNSSVCLSWRLAGWHQVTEETVLLLLSDGLWAWSKLVGNKSIHCFPGLAGTYDWLEDWHGIWQTDKTLAICRKTLGTISKTFWDIQSYPGKQTKQVNTLRLHARRLFPCVSSVGHGKNHSKSDLGRNRQAIQNPSISPIPRNGCWRELHKGWKRWNKLSLQKGSQGLGQRSLWGPCVVLLKETHKGIFGLAEAHFVWQRRLWGQNPNKVGFQRAGW